MANISIIVPFYQSESTIEDAIRSVRSQTYPKWELLLIDDGSTDNGRQIAEGWAQEDPRIQVFSQKNQGRSSARNYGIKQSSGNWLCFLDSDDTLRPYALEKLVQGTNSAVDLVCGGYESLNREHIAKRSAQLESRELFLAILDNLKQSNTILDQLKICDGVFERVVWGKLYNAKIVRENKIFFTEGLKFGEDAIFNLDYLAKSRKIGIIDSAVYFYNIGDGNTTRTCEIADFIMLSRFLSIVKLRKDVYLFSGADDDYIDFFCANEIMSVFRKTSRFAEDLRGYGREFDSFVCSTEIKQILSSYYCPTLIGTAINRFYIYLMRHQKSYYALKLNKLIVT